MKISKKNPFDEEYQERHTEEWVSRAINLGIEIKEPPKKYLKILRNPMLLKIIDSELDKKVVGENDARIVIFLIANMRNVENLNKGSDNLIVNALSGTGKDHIASSVFDLIPKHEKEELIRTTPKVLAYTRNRKVGINREKGTEINLPTWKKVALRLEDVSDNVVNDDSFKVFATADPNKINLGKTMIKQKVLDIEIEGKPSMILTMANAEIRNEQLRRFPMIYLDEGVNQSKEILKRQAEYAMKGKVPDYDIDLLNSLIFLKRIKVTIPYANKLIKIFERSETDVIIRTAFNRFLDYIKSSASFFQYQRKIDSDGYIIANLQDFENGVLCLRKTTSNLKLIPLSKLDKAIYDLFNETKLEKKTVEEIMDFEIVQRFGYGDRWIRKRLDFLVSKNFLKRITEKRDNSFKPVCVYSYVEISELNIPSAEELNINSNSSNETNNTINSISSNSSNTSKKRQKVGVSELNEVFELGIDKTHSCVICGSNDNLTPIVDPDGLNFYYCDSCLEGRQ